MLRNLSESRPPLRNPRSWQSLPVAGSRTRTAHKRTKSDAQIGRHLSWFVIDWCEANAMNFGKFPKDGPNRVIFLQWTMAATVFSEGTALEGSIAPAKLSNPCIASKSGVDLAISLVVGVVTVDGKLNISERMCTDYVQLYNLLNNGITMTNLVTSTHSGLKPSMNSEETNNQRMLYGSHRSFGRWSSGPNRKGDVT